MPNVSRTYVAMPADVQEAYEIVRSPVRLRIARHLAAHPDSQISDIVAAVGGQKTTIYEHLVQLERLGVVVPSHESGSRSRRWVTYSIDIGRWNQLVSRLTLEASDPIDNAAAPTGEGQ